MNKEIIVGVDVDNTFNNFSELFVIYLERLTGAKLSINDIDDWNLKTVINKKFNGDIDGEIANEIYQREDFIMELDLVPNSKFILDKISTENKVKVKLVTAMAKKELTPIRDKWLKLKELNNIEVVYENKKETVKMDYLIDDAPHNLEAVSKVIGKENCICLNQLYNSNLDYPRANSLEEAFDYIYKKEGII